MIVIGDVSEPKELKFVVLSCARGERSRGSGATSELAGGTSDFSNIISFVRNKYGGPVAIRTLALMMPVACLVISMRSSPCQRDLKGSQCRHIMGIHALPVLLSTSAILPYEGIDVGSLVQRFNVIIRPA